MNRPMVERTKYQQNIIKNYYQNQDTILLQRLGEQITELYLATGKTRATIWKKVGHYARKAEDPQDAH